jgi:SAM-dependent methyltransferase
MINPSLFHLHHIERDEDVSFWLQLAIEVDGPVLELGCGTGRLLLPLLKSGINLCGLDRNYEMLSYLNSQLPNQFLGQVKTFQADLGYFHLDREFSLIFLACNTLSTLQEKTRKSGLVHLASLPVLGEPEIEATFSHPSSGNPIQVSSEWRRFERYIDFSWHYDHLLPDGLIERQTVQSRHNMISLGEYKGELREAHLDLINLYGDYDKAIYQDDSPYLIMITRKTPGF